MKICQYKTKFVILLILLTVCLAFCGFCPSVFLAKNETTSKSIKLPIVMYHSVLVNRKGVYIVSPLQLKNDIIALKNQGYNFVLPLDVVAFAQNIAPLPSKPIMLTFDDGHYNFLHYALPIIKKYDAKALVNVIGAFSAFSTDSGDNANPNYSHLTWAEISALSNCSQIEIGNHTYNLHKYRPRYGIGKMYGETDKQYLNVISTDLIRLQNKLKSDCNVTPIAFAYPFGKYTQQAVSLLPTLGFKMSFTCNEGISTIERGEPSSLYGLRRINRSGAYSSSELLRKISKNSK